FPWTYQIGERKHRCSGDRLKACPTLFYINEFDGVLCTHCFLANGGKKVDKLFFDRPFQTWHKLKNKYNDHVNAERCHLTAPHKLNFQRLQDLLPTIQGSRGNVIHMINKDYVDYTNKKKYVLKRIISSLHWLGRQGLAIRGKSDKYSNFKSLIQEQARYDPMMEEHLKSTVGTRKAFLSHRTQEEFIEGIGKQISDSHVQEIKSSPYFSILADEGTDSSNKVLLSTFFRFLFRDPHTKKWTIKERFLGFSYMTCTTGAALKETLYNICNKLGVNMRRFKGQGYDGAGNMSGKDNGLQALVKRDYPRADYYHCFAHCLNLAINKACDLKLIKRFVDIIFKVTYAFKKSPKRQVHFTSTLNKPEFANVKAEVGEKEKIEMFCQTRWTARCQSSTTFKQCFPVLGATFQALDELPGSQQDKDAYSMLCLMHEFSFIISLCVVEKTLGKVLNLSVLLQEEKIDLVHAWTSCKLTYDQIHSMLSDPNVWPAVWYEAERLATAEGVEVTVPREVRRQLAAEVRAGGVERIKTYYYNQLWRPYLLHLLQELESRILSHEGRFLAFILTPKFNFKLRGILDDLAAPFQPQGEVESIFKAFEGDLPLETTYRVFVLELQQWAQAWSRVKETKWPHNVLDTLNNDEVEWDLFPNIHIIFLILAVLPVTTSSVERSVSLLRRLKTWLRSSMGEGRLNALAFMMANPDFDVDEEKVLHEWYMAKNRNIHLA
ncbi:unnamed protein product, partial [Heterosigma akashiwo]